ncbi:UV radiation resistance protein and autophagy-related subunit 14-domain-containing protein [Delphinella strobiligena]|nr:UV radiation resistance protein and autophagy-related subunit 14-domain-containing protein [Delphinella strobiligena]
MDCSICSTSFSSRGQATCASCARALVYQNRLDHLTHLLDKESLQRTVGLVVSSPLHIDAASLASGSDLVDISESATKQRHGRVLGETEAIEARCAQVDQQLQVLNKQIRDARAEKLSRMAEHERRRSEMTSEKQLLERRMPQLLEPLQTNARRLHRKLDKVHAKTCEGRVKLCHETARLAGLKQRRRKTSHGQIVQDYTIAGVPIPDLRHLHTARPDQVTAALANICRLLTTTCHYLFLRLPAEITPPHANYPHPTIFSVQSSYKGFDMLFPVISTPHAAPPTPSSSRLLEHRSLPKLRLLHLDKPLVRTARDDPNNYNLFVEGVTLLAWDVAWLCRSQGLFVANTWDDVCDLGKNLCILFRCQPGPSPPTDLPVTQDPPLPTPSFGELSHAAIHSNIEGPMGIALMRTWRLASPHRLIDKVKSHLLAEMSGAEWELIVESEWDVEREDEQAVLVGGMRPADVDSENVTKAKGSSGWTVLRGRGTNPA